MTKILAHIISEFPLSDNGYKQNSVHPNFGKTPFWLKMQ